MKNIKIASILFFVGILLGCNRQKECFYLDTRIDIQYKDNLGRDLLDSSKAYAFKYDSIKHFYKNANNQIVEVYSLSMDYPKAFVIHLDADSIYTLSLTPYGTDILQLNSSISDTLVSEIVNNTCSTITKKVWYNGVLVYDGTSQRKFIINK
ncbi:MAG: hypothetical protein IPL21_06495 [Saprospirales bacterium]|jgi:membrane carboxypeptidase/penicillin-binding protein|nr:hypothetical protein [Saprospirales bacterium]